MAQYRYSVPRFRRTLAAALAMTAMVAGLVWMVVRAARSPDALYWAGAAALVFFAFVSAGMLVRYLRNEVVLAVGPTGLYDARLGEVPLAWDDIREAVLSRREDDFILEVYLWQPQCGAIGDGRPDFEIELADLERQPMQIVADIGRYKPVAANADRGLQPMNGEWQ